MEDKYYFVAYYSNSTMQFSNVILVGVHPIIWLSSYPKHLPVYHILFWQEITQEIVIQAKEMNYIPYEEWEGDKSEQS